jgi:hypothetical protein
MIERYVFIKLTDDHSTPEGRRAVIDHTRATLPDVPGTAGVTVGAPADESAEAAWDVSIVVRFASLADVEPYRTHPAHRAYVDEFLRPRMAVIKAWSFDTSE